MWTMENPQPIFILLECFETKRLTPRDENVYLTCDVTEAQQISPRSSTCILKGTHRVIAYKFALDWPALNERTCKYLRNKVGHKDVTLTITSESNCDTSNAVGEYKSNLVEKQNVKLTVLYLLTICENTIQDGVFRIQQPNSAVKEEIVEEAEEFILWPSEAFELYDYYENVHCVVVRNKRFLVLPPVDLDRSPDLNDETSRISSVCDSENGPELETCGEFAKLSPGLQHHLPEIHGVCIITPFNLSLHEWPALITDHPLTVTSDIHLEISPTMQTEFTELFPFCAPTKSLAGEVAPSHSDVETTYASHTPIIEPVLLSTSHQDVNNIHDSSYVSESQTVLDLQPIEATLFDPPCSPESILPDVSVSCTSYNASSPVPSPEVTMRNFSHSATCLDNSTHSADDTTCLEKLSHSVDDATCLHNSSHFPQRVECIEMSQSCHDGAVSKSSLDDTVLEDYLSSRDICMNISNIQQSVRRNSQTISLPTNKFGVREFVEAEGCDDAKDTTTFSRWKQKLDDKADILHTTADHIERLQFEIQEYMQQLGVKEDTHCETNLPCNVQIMSTDIMQSTLPKKKVKTGNSNAKPRLQINAFRRFCAKQQTTLERFPSLDHEKVSQLLVKKWNALGQEERDSYELKLHKELKQVCNKHVESKKLVNDVSLHVELNTEKLRSRTRKKVVCYKPWSRRSHGKCNRPTNQNTVLQKQLGQEVMWVQCDKCNKWRKLSIVVDLQNLPEKWDCTFNSDPKYNRCDAKEELTDNWHWHIVPDSRHPSKDYVGLEQTEIHNYQTEKLQIDTDISKISKAALHKHVGHTDQAQRWATLKSKKKNCRSLNYTHNFKRRLGLLKKNSKTKPSSISRKIKRLNDLENSLWVGSKHRRILNDGCLNRKNIEVGVATQPVSVVPKVPIIKSQPNITVLAEEHSNSDNVEDMSHDPSFPVNTIHDRKQTKRNHIQCASLTTDEMDNLEDTFDLDHWRQQLERGIEVMHTTFKKSKNENKLLPQQANVNKTVGKQQKKQTFLQDEKMLKVQCSKCHKWRNVPAAVYMEISESWACCVDSKQKDGICDTQASPRSTIKKKMSIRQVTKLQPKKNLRHTKSSLRLDETDVDRPTECKYQSDDNRSDKDAVSVTGHAHKGKNRSHKGTKFTENGLRRPMNAFIKFTAEFREIVAETNPNRNNREISKLLGRMWRKMTAEEKEPYVAAFQAELETIRAEHPEWKYNSGQRLATLGNGADLSTIKERRLRTRKLTQLMNYRDYFSRPYAKQRKKTNEDGRNLSQIDTWQNLEESWVQCDECNKWRKLPSTVDSQNLPKKWRCSLNPDTEHNYCEAEEEVVSDQWNWHVFTSSDTESTDCVEVSQSETKNMSSCSTSSSNLINKVGCDRGTLAADSVNTTFAHNVKLKGMGTHGKSLQKTTNDTSNWKEQPNPKKKKEVKPLQTAAINLLESYSSSHLKRRKIQNKIVKKIRTTSAVPSEILSENSGQMIANSDQNHKELRFKAQHTPTVNVLVENEVGAFNHLKPSSRPGDLMNDKLEELKVLDKDSQLSDNMINAELLRRLDISIKKRRQQEKIRCVKKIKTSLRPKVRTDSQTRQCKTSSKIAKSHTKKKRILQHKGDMVIEQQLRFDYEGKNSSLVQYINLPEKELRRNVDIVPVNDTCQQNVPSEKIGNLTKVGKLKSNHCNDVNVDDLLCHEVLPEFSDTEDKTEPSLFKQHIDSNDEKQVDKNSKQDVICQVVLPEFSASDGTSEPSFFKDHVDNNGKTQVSNNSKEQVTISITPQVCSNPKQMDNNTTQVKDNTKQMDNNVTQVTQSTKQQVGLCNNVNANIVLKTADFRELLSCAIRSKKQLGKPCQLGATLPVHSQHSTTQSAQHFHKTPLQSCIMKDKSDHGLMKPAINNVANTELLHQQAMTDCGEQLLSKVSNQSLQATVKYKLKTILKKLSPNHSNKEMNIKLKPSNSDVLQAKDGFINSVDNQSMVQADTTNYNEKEETSPSANDATMNEAAKFVNTSFPEKEIEIIRTAGRQIDASNLVNDVPLGSQQLKSMNTCPAYKKYSVNNHSHFDLLLKQFYEQRRRRKCTKCSKYIKIPDSVVIEDLPQTWSCSVCDAVDASNRSSVSKTAAEQENVCRPELKETNTEILFPGMAPDSTAQRSPKSVCGLKGVNNLSVFEQTVDRNTVAPTACASQVSFNMGKDKEEPVVLKKKKRLKIDDPTKLKRPMNAFIKFSREYRELVQSYFPKSTNREVSVLLGRLWRRLIPEEKEPYIAAFKLDLSQMRTEHPEWNYASTKRAVDLVPVTEQRLRTRKIEPFLNYRDFFRRQYTKKKLEVGASSHNCDPPLQNQDVPVCNRDLSLRNKDDVWVQCDECNKWRKLPASVDSSYPLPDKWTCHLNPDLQRNCCDADEEEY